jgi:excisionase family DNA binding protein
MTCERPHRLSSDRASAAGCAESRAEPTVPLPDAKLADLRRRTTCSVEEASVLLGVGRSTAYAAARDGSLPVLRISKRLLVPTAKLLALLGYDDGHRRPD